MSLENLNKRGDKKGRFRARFAVYGDLFAKIFLAAVLLFFTIYFLRHSEDLGGIIRNADPGWLALTLVFFTTFVLMEAHINTLLIFYMASGNASARKRAKRDIAAGMKIVLLSFFARYTPGKVWVLSMRLHLFSRLGVRVQEVLSATFLENIYVLGSGLAAFLLLSAFRPPGWNVPSLLAGSAVLLALALHPGLILSIFDSILKRMKFGIVGSRLSHTQSSGFILYYLLAWIITGSGASCLALALGYELALSDIPYVIGTYIGSVTLGFLAVFAPGGIGVREGMFALAMHRFGTPVQALTLAMAARMVMSIAEVVSFVLLGVGKRRRVRTLKHFISLLTHHGQLEQNF